MLPRVALVLMITAGAGACGDNEATQDAAVKVPPDAPPALHAIVAAGNMFADMNTESWVVARPRVSHAILGASPIVRHVAGQLAVIDRDASGSVTLYADTDVAFTTLTSQTAFASPQDVALVGSALYVPQRTQVIASTTGDITLSDPGAVCTSAIAVGSDVYVACAMSSGPANVFVIDSTTNTVRTSFALAAPTPTSLFEAFGDGTGDLGIATADLTDGTGCVEQIVPGPTPTAQCLVSNLLNGGFSTRLQFEPLQGSVFLWMAVTGTGASAGLHQLMAYDVTVSEGWPPISTMGEDIGDVALCPDGTLVLTELTIGAAGLRVYRLATEVTSAPISVGMAPNSPHGVECY